MPTRPLFIGLLQDEPVGQVRLDGTGDGSAEVGISVAPDRRGQGLGADLLAAVVEAGRDDAVLSIVRFVARIRVGNERCGCSKVPGSSCRGTDTCEGSPCLIYELRA
jgi:RimJ/RimL family protein N-acetyltransferase